ncbi:response regulator [Myxococcus sp. MxC21-1]|uniref:ATP-binding response regulator n=1 Tax=Myxococcus sp. MxC21-1 TaxID=3041439 RepID=UPI00292E604F|nr:response regulator [Myxococcus sp. MxC21-1]WNZ59132.1 response regulator [Myxococcus sp. MxC21-1]
MSLVLVADDEPAVLEVLSQVVEDLGHDVLRARDGEEALGLARARHPQLVVTDHMMPRLSGVELCRRMKQEAQLKDVPVILLSAVLPQGAPEAFAFLHKPFEITDFESVIHKSLAASPEPRMEAHAASPLGALGQWVAQTLQGPLETAREQLRRLECTPSVDRAALDTLAAQLQSIETVGRHLRELAWLSSGEATLKRIDTDVGQHLRDAVAAHGAHVTLDVPEAPVHAQVDPPRIRQVFDVLLANAVRQGDAEVALEVSQTQLTVRVKDAGPGLAAEALAHLFTPFRMDAKGVCGPELYVASELVRLQGGALSVQSRPGEGSTFSLMLPRST